MRVLLQFLVVMVAMLAGASSVRAAEPEQLASSEELHKLFNDGQYQPLLAKLPRVLALKGPAAAKYDLVDLNLLKADAFIQLKQQSQAMTALNDAVKAITPETSAEMAAKARAQQILVKQSQGLAYTPKADKARKPIPLADMTQRKVAYTALLADMQADVAAKIKAAQSAKALPPIVTAVQGLSDMGAVETVATGSNQASSKAADDLAGGAKRLMNEAVATMSASVAAIDKKANEMTPYGVREVPVNTGNRGGDGQAKPRTVPEQTMRKTGLTTATKNELRDIVDTCDRVSAVCLSFEQVSKQHAAGFQDIATAATKTARDASFTLSADYSGIYVNSERRTGTSR